LLSCVRAHQQAVDGHERCEEQVRKFFRQLEEAHGKLPEAKRKVTEALDSLRQVKAEHDSTLAKAEQGDKAADRREPEPAMQDDARREIAALRQQVVELKALLLKGQAGESQAAGAGDGGAFSDNGAKEVSPATPTGVLPLALVAAGAGACKQAPPVSRPPSPKRQRGAAHPGGLDDDEVSMGEEASEKEGDHKPPEVDAAAVASQSPDEVLAAARKLAATVQGTLDATKEVSRQSDEGKGS